MGIFSLWQATGQPSGELNSGPISLCTKESQWSLPASSIAQEEPCPTERTALPLTDMQATVLSWHAVPTSLAAAKLSGHPASPHGVTAAAHTREEYLSHHQQQPVLLQNPDAIKLKEEISRLTKKIKAGQPALAESQKELADQRRKLAKIKADLEDLTAGETALASLGVGKGRCSLQDNGGSAAAAGRAGKTKACTPVGAGVCPDRWLPPCWETSARRWP